MIHSLKKTTSPFIRAVAGITAIGATTLTVIGIASALFSATQTSDSNTFTTGSISVGLGTESVTCDIPQIMPGDSSAGAASGSQDLATCVYDVRYTGNAPAWLAVDVLVTAGVPSLYTGDVDGLQLGLSANDSLTLAGNNTFLDQNGGSTSIVAGTVVENLLISTTPAEQGDAVTFDLDYLLPATAPNALQGASASVTLTFHAVQSDNQPIDPCVAGRQCLAIDWG